MVECNTDLGDIWRRLPLFVVIASIFNLSGLTCLIVGFFSAVDITSTGFERLDVTDEYITTAYTLGVALVAVEGILLIPLTAALLCVGCMKLDHQRELWIWTIPMSAMADQFVIVILMMISGICLLYTLGLLFCTSASVTISYLLIGACYANDNYCIDLRDYGLVPQYIIDTKAEMCVTTEMDLFCEDVFDAPGQMATACAGTYCIVIGMMMYLIKLTAWYMDGDSGGGAGGQTNTNVNSISPHQNRAFNNSSPTGKGKQAKGAVTAAPAPKRLR